MSKLGQATIGQAPTQTLLGVHRYRITVFWLAGAYIRANTSVFNVFWSQLSFAAESAVAATTEFTPPSCGLPRSLRGLHQHLCDRPLPWLSICEGLSWPLPVIKRLSRVKRWLEQSSVSFLYFAFPNSKPRLRLLPLFVSGRSCCIAALANDNVVNFPRGRELIAFDQVERNHLSQLLFGHYMLFVGCPLQTNTSGDKVNW